MIIYRFIFKKDVLVIIDSNMNWNDINDTKKICSRLEDYCYHEYNFRIKT